MRVTLAEFMMLTPAERRLVTHIEIDNKFEERLQRGPSDSERYIDENMITNDQYRRENHQ